ncbi:MAG TPA: DUF4168 domain-containing protein [Croceibacterium sp.]|nr:DUF4168 domain-containing protein [Croceibacterium sp.]
MKKLTYPLIAFAFAATAAQAQDAAPPAEQDAAQPATPQAAPDQSASPDAQPQDALPPSGPATAPADAAAPPASAAAPSTGAVASATVTDAEVSSYAEAASKVQEIAKNAALPDDAKQQQMASAVTAAGLEPQRFNEISQAVGADADLRARIQTAMAAHSAPSDG